MLLLQQESRMSEDFRNSWAQVVTLSHKGLGLEPEILKSLWSTLATLTTCFVTALSQTSLYISTPGFATLLRQMVSIPDVYTTEQTKDVTTIRWLAEHIVWHARRLLECSSLALSSMGLIGQIFIIAVSAVSTTAAIESDQVSPEEKETAMQAHSLSANLISLMTLCSGTIFSQVWSGPRQEEKRTPPSLFKLITEVSTSSPAVHLLSFQYLDDQDQYLKHTASRHLLNLVDYAAGDTSEEGFILSLARAQAYFCVPANFDSLTSLGRPLAKSIPSLQSSPTSTPPTRKKTPRPSRSPALPEPPMPRVSPTSLQGRPRAEGQGPSRAESGSKPVKSKKPRRY